MRIVITFQYFLPAFKAGGPIQSINNIADFLSSEGMEVYIICSDKDLDGTKLSVPAEQWVETKKNVHVFYVAGKLSKQGMNKLLNIISPDVIFINGLYSPVYTIYPLLYNSKGRKILSVRGMLHPGALSQKKLKKRIYLNVIKVLGLHKKCEYHTTTDDETGYVKKEFGAGITTWMVPNLPNVLDYCQPIEKEPGTLKMVSVSLISPMKNIYQVLKALLKSEAKIEYDIFGPVKDSGYWNRCNEILKTLPANINVNYKGEILPHEIADVLAKYHVFILPSKSENFGHAIYEALSAGRPVITSHNTPWNNLRDANAGFNINPDNIDELTGAVDNVAFLHNDIYRQMSMSAKEYITGKYNIESIKEQYRKMFSVSKKK